MLERPAILQGMEAFVLDRKSRITPLIKLILEQHGVTVHTATSCQEAIYSLQRRKSDFIMVDIGEDTEIDTRAIKHLRDDIPLMHLPLFAVAKEACDRIRWDCLSAGADAILAKPLEPRKLVVTITKIMETLCTLRPPRGCESDALKRTFEESRLLHNPRQLGEG